MNNDATTDPMGGLVRVFVRINGHFHKIQFSDRVALYSMLGQMWKQNHNFVLACGIDNDGFIYHLAGRPCDSTTVTFTSGDGYAFGDPLYYLRTVDINPYKNRDHRFDQPFYFLRRITVFPALPMFIPTWLADFDLPDFKKLFIHGKDAPDPEWSLSQLRTIDSRLSKNITWLKFTDWQTLSYSNLEPLMVEILPKLPNLEYLCLPGDDIPNFPDVVDRIIRRNRKESNNTIRSKWLHIGGLPSTSQDIAIRKALVRFLQHFSTVNALHKYEYNEEKYPIDVQCALIQNIVGRRLLEGNKHGNGDSVEGGDDVGNNDSKRKICKTDKAFIPVSVWPIVLKRAERQCNRHCNRHWRYALPGVQNIWSPYGLYYLLREGLILPHLVERHRLEESRTDSPKGKRLKTESD